MTDKEFFIELLDKNVSYEAYAYAVQLISLKKASEDANRIGPEAVQLLKDAFNLLQPRDK